MLSEDAKSHLKTLLPPTAFTDWRETLGEDHPALEGLGVNVDREVEVIEAKAEVGAVENEKDKENAMVVDEEPVPHSPPPPNSNPIPDSITQTHPHSSRELSLSFFTDSHFYAALRTFQDHLYLNYFSDAHVQKVKAYQEGIVSGTLAAPWKDKIWERDNPVSIPAEAEHVPAGTGSSTLSGALAG